MALIYGQPKRMKTSMLAAAMPNALWIAGEGATAIRAVAENELGFSPIIHPQEVRRLDDLINILHPLIADGTAAQYGGICIDGFTALCDSHVRWWADNPKITDGGKEDRWFGYMDLKNKLQLLSEELRHVPTNVGIIAHEQAPSQKEGVFVPGGPAMGSKGRLRM